MKDYDLPKHIMRFTDEQILEKTGLSPELFKDDESGFYSGLYYNTLTDEYIVAFRGTEGTGTTEANKDNKANVTQSIGVKTAQYINAMSLAKLLKDSPIGDKIKFTGHSLGGSLASAATVVTGSSGTITFNAAGLHRNTPYLFNGTSKFNSGNSITNFFVRGELLTFAQGLTRMIAPFQSIVPNAAGRFVPMEPVNLDKNMLQMHVMTEVIESLLRYKGQ